MHWKGFLPLFCPFAFPQKTSLMIIILRRAKLPDRSNFMFNYSAEKNERRRKNRILKLTSNEPLLKVIWDFRSKFIECHHSSVSSMIRLTYSESRSAERNEEFCWNIAILNVIDGAVIRSDKHEPPTRSILGRFFIHGTWPARADEEEQTMRRLVGGKESYESRLWVNICSAAICRCHRHQKDIRRVSNNWLDEAESISA